MSIAARAIWMGEASLLIAGGVESMSRAPFVMGKAARAFSRQAEIYETTFGWRFVIQLDVATAGVQPRVMGIGPAPAFQKVMPRLGMTIVQFDVIELNETFASQDLAVLRMLGVADDDQRVIPNGGAIARGHPLDASGARLVMTASYQLERMDGRFALSRCASASQSRSSAFERSNAKETSV